MNERTNNDEWQLKLSKINILELVHIKKNELDQVFKKIKPACWQIKLPIN